MLLEEGVCYDQCVILANLCKSLSCFILYSKAKFACYFSYLLTSHFCIPVPYDENDIFSLLVVEGLVGLHKIIVKCMVFPVVMCGCESWTIKKAEHGRIDAFELWC